MAKKKEEIKKEVFNIEEEMENVNEFLRDGFKKFLKKTQTEGVKTKKEFDKLLEEYGGV